MFSIYISALVATIALQAAPGPNLIAVAGVALSQGRMAAILVASGVAVGVLVWVSAFAIGVSVLFERYPLAGITMQFLGGSYLLVIGSKALINVFRSTPGLIVPRHGAMSGPAAFRRGLFVVLTNPKAALMWAAITSFMRGSGLSGIEVVGYAPIGAISALVVYGCYALLFSTAIATHFYDRVGKVFELVFGGFFAAFGISAIYAGVIELKLASTS